MIHARTVSPASFLLYQRSLLASWRPLDPAEVARLSGVGLEVPADVPHTYGFATGHRESWALTMMTGPVATIPFVATRDADSAAQS